MSDNRQKFTGAIQGETVKAPDGRFINLLYGQKFSGLIGGQMVEGVYRGFKDGARVVEISADMFSAIQAMVDPNLIHAGKPEGELFPGQREVREKAQKESLKDKLY